MGLKIRQLTRADRKRLTDMIIELTDKCGSDVLRKMVPHRNLEDTELADDESEKGEGEPALVYELVLDTMRELHRWLEHDVTLWFMDLLDIKTIEEFDKLPFNVDAIIIEQLLEEETFIHFFSKGSLARNMIRGFVSRLFSGKKK